MSEILLFLVLGLGVGAVYAALTLGVVLTYQGTGMINFAAAAMAAVPMYVYEELQQGRLTLPVPWLPSFDVGDTPTWLAVAIAVAVAGLLGALTELAVSRPLRKAPPLAKVVAAVGILLTLQAVVGLKYGTVPLLRSVTLPQGAVEMAGVNVAKDRLWLVGIAVALSVGLALWFRKSRMGLAIQASAENERAAGFARLSPTVTGLVTWTVSSMFTALILVLAGPATGTLSPSTMPLLVVPALAGALVARLSSLTVGLVGALTLGVVQSILQYLSQTKDWWPEWAKQGLTNVVPFLVIVVALFVLGRAIPTRGDDVRSSLPAVLVPRNRPHMVAVWSAVGLAALALTSGTYRFGVITSLAVSLIALSLVLLTGLLGQISLAQAAFAGVAGIVLSKLGDSVPFPLSLFIAAALAAVAGVFVGIPALRIRGAQLAVVTLAAALTLQDFVLANPKIVSATANLIPDPVLFGWNLSVRGGQDIARLPFGVMVLVIVVVASICVGNLMRAGTGRTMLAIRSNERAAAAIGINVPRVKLAAFAASSFLAGLGGGLIGYSRGQLSADSFGVFIGLSFLAVAYLSGITSVSGAALAGVSASLGIVYVFMDRNLHLGSYYMLITGISLILTVLFNPIGIAGKTRSDYEKARARLAPHKSPAKPMAQSVESDSSPAMAETPRQIGDVSLSARGVTVRYGGVEAVSDVHIEVRAGEIVGLIGPNGAGKTSFVDALTGFTRSSGEVDLAGDRLDQQPAHERARRGLVRTWQASELFEDLTVGDNVRVANETGNEALGMLRDSVRPTTPASAPVERALALMSLTDVADRKPSELPLGRQKAVGMARALAMEPQVLLLDEPAAGLDSTESLAFGDQLRRIAATGVGCLLIDHDMHLVMSVCDRVYVIEFGKQIATGTPEAVRTDPLVLKSYLGNQSFETTEEADDAPVGKEEVGS
ncbi:ABC-type branched-subunit amino acid transport system ATPase component/branched-subunit amino acid ABC-type transport system permease component [Streptomyces sp. SAI-135]|uniref:branched-chain amino acid ABC transporter permease/ATP-binding protein n=1 Tax=unclassified Streptomyces TaxID=2593676 RepID=UPI002474CAF2|nr:MULTISPECIES: branched-chain amino acid ABC transporter permease/ATP-binding protein [unclassified Streptomyces]MDH6522839.1 ABC-type branched-subunit amino acid transport system ATPase component/branched-subunit amino acid ABC-type transport system permease component [Streptomyces sp. SAI-090]MDH6573726.1 ABC-type branched-subunit amino acid transport system ATPase component/branched-subunit amino acid ABC-type transport system permease component [Streptomyces sp. SAI-117]MDH6581543.1 ABC-ty